MWRRFAGLLIGAAASLVSTTALAGPVELLNGVSIDPADPAHMIVPYSFGGNGMFVSKDGGKTLSWLCSAGIAPNAVNRNGRAFIGGDSAIYLGLFDGLVKGTPDGCGFAPVPELDKKYIADLASDPIDTKRMYIITTNAMAENFVWMNDGSGTFAPIGTGVTQFLDTLDVVKVGDKRRFYVTGVVTNVMTNEVKYSVRVSEDDATTWTDDVYDVTQFGPMDKFAEFGIVAINPQNPDHVVGRVWRKMAVDALVYSTEKGKAGSWKLIAEPNEVDSVTFSPEGVLYFGDSDQKSKGVWVVEKEGDAPKLLNDTWKPSCLSWDEANKRLLGCGNFYLFGEVDTTSGELKPLLDLRCTEHMVDCPGQEAIATVCEPQAQADFCHLSHWVIAPVCDQYDRGPELATFAASQTFMCVDGFGVSKDPAAGGAAGSGAAGAAGAGAAMMGAAGAAPLCAAQSSCVGQVTAGAQAQNAGGAGGGSTTEKKSSGGGCSAVSGSSEERFGALLLSLGMLGLAARTRRRRG
jgi:hypothetical protein